VSTAVSGTIDTEGAPGGATTVPTSQSTGADVESAVSGATGKTGAAPPPTPAGPTPDTEAASGGTAASLLFPAVSATPPTTLANSGAPDVLPAYRAPSAAPSATTYDSTHTQDPTTDGLPPAVSPGTLMHASIDCSAVGAAPAPVGGVPAAPTGVSAAAGSRSATVSWTGSANPDASTNKVSGYIILGSTGGTAYAAANATSAVVTGLVPGQAYTFKVAARSPSGVGAYSTASGAVTPWDPDEPDVNKPAGLDAYSASEPIYRSDGTIVPGSWGRPTAPTAVACVTGGSAGRVTVNWTAPSSGAPSGGYSIVLTDTTSSATVTRTAASGATSSPYTGLTTGHSVKAVVTAIGQLASTASASSATFTVP
jgi:hypothetical protein